MSEEDEEHILEDEPLKVLSLFRRRQISNFQLSLESYSKLFDNLCCTICRDLFNNPVYLKCSHRFCKDCIEKYIRSNTKKSCPNCRGGLNTKRDLHLDYNLESLILYAYGDSKKLTKEIESIQLIELENVRLLSGKKSQSQIQNRLRPRDSKTDYFEEGIIGLKKIKTNDGEEVRRGRKKAPVLENKIENNYFSEKESPSKNLKEENIKSKSKISSKNDLLLKQINDCRNQQRYMKSQSAQQVFEEILTKSKKNKAVEFIEIKSNSDYQHSDENDESQEQIKVQLPVPEQNSKEDAKDSLEEEESGEIKNDMDERNMKEMEEKEALQNEIANAKELLRREFGEKYLAKIIEISQFNVMVTIKLERYPNNPFTPQLDARILTLSIKSSISAIQLHIANKLNLNKEAVKIYTKTEGLFQTFQSKTTNSQFSELFHYSKLNEINEKYWKSSKDVEFLDMSEMLQTLDFNENNNFSLRQFRVLFYSVDFAKITQ